MATITSSTIIEDAAQVDGRRHVRERHVDSVGAVHRFAYTAEAEADVNAILAARAAALPGLLRDEEVQRNLANAVSDDPASASLLYSSKNDFAPVLRAAFKASKARDTIRLGWYVAQFGLTDNQLKNLFSLSDQQLAAFKSKLGVWSQKYTDMQGEVGE